MWWFFLIKRRQPELLFHWARSSVLSGIDSLGAKRDARAITRVNRTSIFVLSLHIDGLAARDFKRLLILVLRDGRADDRADKAKS